jgi:hypothetical protein
MLRSTPACGGSLQAISPSRQKRMTTFLKCARRLTRVYSSKSIRGYRFKQLILELVKNAPISWTHFTPGMYELAPTRHGYLLMHAVQASS